jgi:tetratricopeptide (TPR) repeat protein
MLRPFWQIEGARMELDHKRVIALCTQSIDSGIYSEIPPLLADLYEYRGDAYAAMDEHESAIRDYEVALELDPSPEEAGPIRKSLENCPVSEPPVSGSGRKVTAAVDIPVPG